MEKENCLYLQVAHCNKCGGESGYNIYDGEKICFDCGEPYKADFSVSKVESTITTTNTQPKEEVTAEWLYRKNRKRLEDLTEKELKKRGFTKTQDTPEEWEEKQRNLIEKAQEKYFDFRRREQLLDGDVEIYRNTREYVEKELVEDIINFTKQLLKERERWAIDTFLKDTASYNSFHNGRPRTMRNGLSGEGFEVRVSKLSKKK